MTPALATEIRLLVRPPMFEAMREARARHIDARILKARNTGDAVLGVPAEQYEQVFEWWAASGLLVRTLGPEERS